MFKNILKTFIKPKKPKYNAIRYRIYTEAKNIKIMNKILSKFYTGFTVNFGIGFYKKEKENSVQITVYEKNYDLSGTPTIGRVIKLIKRINKQERVLFVRDFVYLDLV